MCTFGRLHRFCYFCIMFKTFHRCIKYQFIFPSPPKLSFFSTNAPRPKNCFLSTRGSWRLILTSKFFEHSPVSSSSSTCLVGHLNRLWDSSSTTLQEENMILSGNSQTLVNKTSLHWISSRKKIMCWLFILILSDTPWCLPLFPGWRGTEADLWIRNKTAGCCRKGCKTVQQVGWKWNTESLS